MRYRANTHTHTNTHTHRDSNEYPIVAFSKNATIISDTNYLVKTPGRRKETQVCHINMLKAYHEKPKPELVTLNKRLGLERPTHSKDCVGQVAEKEEDTESEVRLGND